MTPLEGHRRVMLGGYPFWSDIWVRSGWRVQEGPSGDFRLLDADDRQIVDGDAACCMEMAANLAPPTGPGRSVVLLHGLGRSRAVMDRMEAALVAEGWNVANVGYPTLRQPFDRHPAVVSRIAAAMAEHGDGEVSLVGHSLGGLVARATAARAEQDGWSAGRLLLIGSPAQGSVMAEALDDLGPMRLLIGDCGVACTPKRAVTVAVPVCRGIAIVAGGNGWLGYNPILQGDNDGVVAVSETRIPGCEYSFLLVPSLHTPLPCHPATVAAAARFLKTGQLTA